MSLRSNIADEAEWGVANSPDIFYEQVRPDPLRNYKAHRLPITTDCSGYITCVYYAAGAPDPNGLNYSGQGNTETLISHLPAIQRGDAEAGDLVIFGPRGATTHGVILKQDGDADDPDVFSHGQDLGPWIKPLSVEANAHPGQPLTYLRGVPPQRTVTHRWNVVNGSGEMLAERIEHPVRWALGHPKAFRKNWNVEFKRTS